MKKLLYILLTIMISLSSCARPQLKEGDIIFHTSKSPQSKFLVAGTGSLATHCGIIVERQDGLYVYEATGPVKLTPLQEWIDRGVGKRAWYRRVTEKPLKVRLDYKGQKYDFAFKFDNGKMYCSELVYLIYKEQFGIELCEPRPINDYHVGMPFAKEFIRKRGISLYQKAVAPCDIQDSDKVYKI